MLELDKVVLRSGTFELRADLDVDDRAIVAVIGPSGAGKSTLLNAIAGFQPITEGQLKWQGTDITQAAPSNRPVAMLFQDNNLFPHLSLAQNIGLGLHPTLRLSSEDQAKVEHALQRVGLQGLGARKPADVSGGQQSRAALARILLQKKPLILLDEPFAALGPAMRREMLDLVAELARESGATVLMVSHAPSDARQIADQVILVADNIAHPPLATDELLDNPPAALRDYLG
ncbi:Thiamine import ATP-binding protein ThiQ (plasmid) [Pseudoseohaeicola sp. NH-UV-7]|uniref:thiamine ABC transporter ATP-binding protein n=1 Tax=unclassified Sulfitobacter TaxID=196795 RepID=UPI000E0A85B4|nr:thiamine ABC transporter ATP-binding protein [Sulfitobacter sp. JL08]AXI57156.1 thiamine ABC transporter ATP-binding protein [Sulfitobacter sp. JL08]